MPRGRRALVTLLGGEAADRYRHRDPLIRPSIRWRVGRRCRQLRQRACVAHIVATATATDPPRLGAHRPARRAGSPRRLYCRRGDGSGRGAPDRRRGTGLSATAAYEQRGSQAVIAVDVPDADRCRAPTPASRRRCRAASARAPPSSATIRQEAARADDVARSRHAHHSRSREFDVQRQRARPACLARTWTSSSTGGSVDHRADRAAANAVLHRVLAELHRLRREGRRLAPVPRRRRDRRRARCVREWWFSRDRCRIQPSVWPIMVWFIAFSERALHVASVRRDGARAQLRAARRPPRRAHWQRSSAEFCACDGAGEPRPPPVGGWRAPRRQREGRVARNWLARMLDRPAARRTCGSGSGTPAPHSARSRRRRPSRAVASC